jgi:hypothetical protein
MASILPWRAAWGALLGACLWSCASIQNGYLATPLDERGQLSSERRTRAGLVISGEERARYASRNFGFVEVTFENTSAEWVRVQELRLDFGDAARDAGVFIPEGDDVNAWYLATVQRNDIRDTNEAHTLGALLFVGEVVGRVAAASDKPAVAGVGAALALGASTAALAQSADRDVQAAQQVHPLPGAHLLSVPFAVPPGLFAKKWVLLNTRPGVPCITSMRISYVLENGEGEQVLLPFRRRPRRRPGGSVWQQYACAEQRNERAKPCGLACSVN